MEPNDPVLAKFELPLRERLFPMGFPVELATNAESVIAAFRESWHEFKQTFERPTVQLSIGVADGECEPRLDPPRVRSREHLLTMFSDADNFVVCDLAHGFGFGWLTPAMVSHTEFVRHYLLDAAAFAIIDQLYLAPVHAALVGRNGMGLLLCGDSLAGKSTLAYALARRGWTLVCDDGAFLVRGGADRYAIGDSHHIRLRTEAKQFFPELAPFLASRRPNGKTALEISTARLDISTMPGMPVHSVVLLNRFAGCPARLVPISPERAMSQFAAVNVYGSQAARDARLNEYTRLLVCQLFQLDYECLDSAMAQLEKLTG